MNVFNDFFNEPSPSAEELIVFAEKYAVTDNIYKEYMLSKLITGDNILSYVCMNLKSGTINRSLYDYCLDDMKIIYEKYFAAQSGFKYKKNLYRVNNFPEYVRGIEEAIGSDSAEHLLNNLINIYYNFGGGELCGYKSYRWDGNKLTGFSSPDTISFSDLVNIENNISVMKNNLDRLLDGKRANNVLLTGDSGTGKSSLVKASLNHYYMKKLRLVELRKNQLSAVPELIKKIGGINFYFIIFIDDLSFGDNEPEYKELKSILDGKTEKQPENILFIATSNRRHILKEDWRDREGSDIHISDTKNETMSLSERFGIHLTFYSQSKAEFLLCVKKKCESAGIEYDNNTEETALRFALRFNGYSGRTAEQFAASIT